MSEVVFKELLEAGAHFGHQTRRWHPKMKRFILSARNGIYIIDLQKTLDALQTVCRVVEKKVREGGRILFIGTKKQAQLVIKEEAQRCSMFFVHHRWLGGMLTNFQTVRKSVRQLDEIDQMEQNDTFKLLPKKEVAGLMKKREKLLGVLEGVRAMKDLPVMLFVVDAKKEQIAIAEAKRLNIDVAAIVDTNTDPDDVMYPIPANDDAIKSIRLIARSISDAVIRVTGKEQSIAAEEQPTAPPVATKEKAEVDEPKRNVAARKPTVKKVKEEDAAEEPDVQPKTEKKRVKRTTPKRKRVEV